MSYATVSHSMSTGVAAERIALIGFGEVGQTLAADLQAAGLTDVAAWDRLFPEPASIPARALSQDQMVQAAAGMSAAVSERSIVISAVTAGDCLAAAREAAPHLAPGTYYFDLNSVAPKTKTEAAALINGVGARFVEAAVMSPIGPKRSASPMLLGGPHAAAFAPRAHALGFAGIDVFADAYGRASAAKMCRSVVVKGMEALLAESLLAARHYGVERTVLASLSDLFPHEDWPKVAQYMISRSLQHGHRRAEEMREVARTVDDAGLHAWMSVACTLRQDWVADRASALDATGLEDMLDRILAQRSRAVAENNP